MLLAILGALGLTALTPALASADEGWVVTRFFSEIEIRPDSTVQVAEDIRVDFGSRQKHGIFRTIPLRYRYDDMHDRYYKLSVQSVTDGSRTVPYTTTVESDNEVIKIGDPNVLVSGPQRYVIWYQVVGAMNSFADHDELFWNVDGGLWPVPKQSVSAVVFGVPVASMQRIGCYQGPSGSTEACKAVKAPANASFASTRELGSGEQMSIVLALDKGAVDVPPPLLEARKRQFPQDAFEVNPLTVGLGLLLFLAGAALILRFWLLHGRDRAYLTRYYTTSDSPDRREPLFAHEPVVVEFEPPQNLKPAELGLVLDESADTKDVTATIVDLAVRGFLTISEVAGKKDWLLKRRQGEVPGLQPYERTLFYGLFANGRQQVKISELKGKFQDSLRAAESQVYADAMEHRFFVARPDIVRIATVGLAVVIALAGGALTYFLGIAFGGGLIGVAVILVAAMLLAFHRAMASRTAAGREVMQKTLGFRLYMNTAEKYRQQFAERAEIFTQLLPYAIVFGCVSRWAKAFEGIDTSAANKTWYTGNAPLQAALLSSSLESMNSSLSAAISSAPPSSGSTSGFGGGGFAGGGGGGGGGGSW